MYITICEIDRQSRFDASDRALRTGVLGWPCEMEWGEVGGGLKMGDKYTPMADSCQCMTKTTTIL